MDCYCYILFYPQIRALLLKVSQKTQNLMGHSLLSPLLPGVQQGHSSSPVEPVKIEVIIIFVD